MKDHQGFSLIELLIVVLIISIIAVIAIPNLLAARRAANEGAALSALRSLHGAQLTYQTSLGGGNYAGTNSSPADVLGLNLLRNSSLIDDVLGSGTKSGYNYSGAVTLIGSSTPATFFFSSNPTSNSGVTQSGTQRYNITQQGVIRSDRMNLGVVFAASTVLSAYPINN